MASWADATGDHFSDTNAVASSVLSPTPSSNADITTPSNTLVVLSSTTATAAAPPRITETSFYPWWFHYFSWTYLGCFIAFMIGCYVMVWWKIRAADREADERELEEKRERVRRLMRRRYEEEHEEAAGWSSLVDEETSSSESGSEDSDDARALRPTRRRGGAAPRRFRSSADSTGGESPASDREGDPRVRTRSHTRHSSDWTDSGSDTEGWRRHPRRLSEV